MATYTHKTQQTGVTLTETLYNQAHQNHVTNATPESLLGFATNATEMQLTTDPGEVGTESLATYVSDELRRLRFILQELKGTDQWYVPSYTATEQVHLLELYRSANQAIGPIFLDGVLTYMSGLWVFPYGYLNGDVTLTAVVRHADASGNIRYTTSVFTAGAGAEAGIILNTGQTVAAASATAEVTVSATLLEANVPVGGTPLLLVFGRDGTHAEDTNSGGIALQSFYVSYTAAAGFKD